MKRWMSLLVLLLVAASAMHAAAEKKEKGAWLFAYFQEPANQGIYLALSRDGLHYTPLNGGQPWVKPAQPGELMRDVFLTRGPDKRFHMVWTWGWHVNSMGYASSPDLFSWSEQKNIVIMKDFPETNNVWAPEIYWDAAKHTWQILWSSASKQEKDRHRIWSSSTVDFETFSKPAVFFDPGYTVIDATVFHEQGQPYRLIFKQQTKEPLTYNVRIASGPSLEGPWTGISEAINEPWSEGPSAIKVGDRYVIFYDHYRGDHIQYEAVASRDWQHWQEITPEIALPLHCKHGSFLRITEKEARRLLKRQNGPSGGQTSGGSQ
jgi:hypothetical protein